MIAPQRAPVRPRVLPPDGGEPVLLEDEVQRLLDRGETGFRWLVGGPGAGKTTALAHLAAVLPENSVELVDQERTLINVPNHRLAVVADEKARHKAPTWHLAPWGEDELIEYLLAVHHDHCAHVMQRLRAAPDRGLPEGNPELWRVVLDEMAGDEGVGGPTAAILRQLARLLPDAKHLRHVLTWALDFFIDPIGANEGWLHKSLLYRHEEAARLMRHRPMRVVAAADQLRHGVEHGESDFALEVRLPHDLVQAAAGTLREDETAARCLQEVLRSSKYRRHAMAASLLHAAGREWYFPEVRRPCLAGAWLAGAKLAGARLVSADLTGTELDDVDLRGAHLAQANAAGASFARADLSGADLEGIQAERADFAAARMIEAKARDADLEGACLRDARADGTDFANSTLAAADLRGASFCRANLARALLDRARVEGADFEKADFTSAHLEGLRLAETNLRGASFHAARLRQCNLEGLDLPQALFGRADLRDALLTGTRVRGGDFREANLQNAGLAEIDWEGADLRGADLRGATFHLGSSRSGLVQSPIASEGSRTGFYTDEYTEQDYRPVEEIRKASLCRADLRGARLEHVDFYLVDLRGARYDADQARHLRQCGAILEERV